MNKIIIKHSSVPGAIPAAGDLTLGELAINVADGLVFAKQLDGSVKTLAEAIEIKSYGKIVGDVGSITATESAQEMTLKGGAGLKVTASNATNAIVVDLDNADAATLGGYAPSHFATADHLHDDRYLKLQSAGGDYYTQSEVDSNIQQAIDDLMGGASSAYDTLKELEEALKDNDSDIAGINAAIATKLAAADYNADDVLSKLKTVDGSGSGLDADLLDGQQGAFYRNASNLNAGTVPTARLSGIYNIGISGNAATATKLVAPVSLTLSGDASGSVSFDGSEDANINVTVANDSHTHDTRYYQKGESDGRYARLDSDNTISGNVTINGKLTAGSAGFKVGEGLEILGEDGYFPNSSYADARILRMLDNNSSGGLVDGGLVIEGYTASDDGRKEVMTLRTNGEFTAFGNKVWHAGNDGDGSELDADMLDGLHASQFARTDAPITDLLFIDRSGEALGIGDSSLDGADAWIRIGNGSYDWQIRYQGVTAGDEGNELQLISPRHGNGLQIDHLGNIEALVDGGKYKVWHSGNDGSNSGLDADKLDGYQATDFMRMSPDGSSYYGMVDPNGSSSQWIRTTASGLIPSVSGGASKIGTKTWPFLEVNALTIFEDGESLSSRYLGLTDKAADSDKLDGLHASSFAQLSGSDFSGDVAVRGDFMAYSPAYGGFPLAPNLIHNSYMHRVGEDGAPVGFYTDGLVTLEAVSPYTKAFEGPYTETASESAVTDPSQATGDAPYWFGRYDKGPRIQRGGMADGWHSYSDGHILKATATGLGAEDHCAIFLPKELNNLGSKWLFSCFVHIAKGSGFTVGVDAGYRSRSASTFISKEETDAGPQGWLRISQMLSTSQITSIDELAISMAILPDENGDIEGYIALPYLALANYRGTNHDTWTGSVIDKLDREGLYINPTSKDVEFASGNLSADGNEVWHAGNHGAGSGLDADKLDGKDSSQFLRSDTGDIMQGRLLLAGDGHHNNQSAAIALALGDADTGLKWISDGHFQLYANNGAVASVRKTSLDVLEPLLQNGNQVWHAGNVGSGSGLDADKLDGVEGSQFLRSDTTDTFTGEITGNTLILGGGKIQTSGAALQVNGFSRMGSIWLHEGDTPEATPAKKLTNSGGTLVWAGSTVWHAGNDGAGSTLDADLLDGQEGSYYAPINSPSFTTPDINDAKVRTLVFDNLEPTNVTNKGDGAVGFDSSQGLLIQRTQSIGDASGSGVYKVLDSSNVAAGANIELSNNEPGLSGTEPFTIAVKQGAGSGLDADKLDGVEASQFARLDGSGTQASTKALTLDLQGHVGDGGNDYGLIIKAFEPAVTLLDRSTNADTGQLLFSGSAFYLRYQDANDGTIGHSDATVGTTNLMKVSTSEIQWMSNDVWHAGNAPIATSSTASTLMKRDGNGDVHARLFRSEFDNTNANIGFIMTQVDTASNNYIRPSTPDQFRAAVTDAHYLSNTGDTMSGTLTISGEGDTTGLRFYSGNDAGGVRLRNPGGNNGELEFWTTDDFSEPFVFRAYDVGNNGTGAYQEWAKISAGGLEIKSGDIHSNNGAFVAHGDVASNSNIDHIWHSDGENAWHFVSDGTYGADGNSTLVAKTLVASDANGIKAEGMVSKSNGNTVIDLTYTPIASNAIGIHTNNSIAAIFDTNNNSSNGNLNFTIGHNGSYGGTNYEELLKIDGIGNYFSKPIYEEGRRVLSEGGIGQFSFNNQDFKGRGKRIAVATTGDLILNYANDFTQVKVQSDMTLDAGTSTTLNILSDAAGISTLNVHGVDQGAGMIYVGQSDTHGGGIEYNGDESTVTTGAGEDYISLFRRNASTDYWTARNKYNSNDWGFRGNVTAYASDARLKENVEVIPDALSKLHQVRGVTYDWREECESLGFMPTQRHEHGVIAQEVQKVVPDAVVPAPFDNDYLTVQHERLIPLLIEAVKELSNKFDQLEARI